MASYEIDRAWAAQFDDHISMITGLEIWRPGSYRQDTRHGIDMVIPQVTLSLRIRRMSIYHGRYRNEITFRHTRANGVKTEWAKMREGSYKAQLFFYGFGDEQTREVKAYTIIDMDRFMTAIPTMRLCEPISNNDGTSHQPVDIGDIPRECILAHKKLLDPIQKDLFVTTFPLHTQFVLVK